MIRPYVWYSLSGQLIHKKVLWAKKRPNNPRAEGDRGANSQ